MRVGRSVLVRWSSSSVVLELLIRGNNLNRCAITERLQILNICKFGITGDLGCSERYCGSLAFVLPGAGKEVCGEGDLERLRRSLNRCSFPCEGWSPVGWPLRCRAWHSDDALIQTNGHGRI